MKFIAILCVLLFLNCKSTETISQTLTDSEVSEKLVENVDWCPEKGTCSFERLENKKATLIKGKFNDTYVNVNNSSASVLKFEYSRDELPGVEDSSYRELVYINLPDVKASFSATGKELLKYNVIYSRLCFCRGATGAYQVTDGELVYTVNENGKHIKLTFKNNQVPQVLIFVEADF